MKIALDPASGPMHRQIAEQIRSMILGGDLPPGTGLPSVRALSEELGTSSLTVHHAYRHLGDLGLVISSPRRGTRVANRLVGADGMVKLDRLPQEGPVSDFEHWAESSGVRSMASSVGDPSLFFPEELLAELEQLRRDSPWNFYYSEPSGAPPLLTQIARIVSRDVLQTDASELVVTSGSTRAIALLLEVLTEPGDTVLIQDPGRLWLTELLRVKRLVGLPLRSVGAGIDIDHATHCARQYRPKLILLSPDFGHATGLVMPETDRLASIRLASDFGMSIVEDGACTALNFGVRKPPAITLLDPAISAYVGSFSYSLCPGVRTGFLRIANQLRSRVTAASQATGVSGSRFLQVALARYLSGGAYDAHLKRVLPRYRARRDAMLSALALHMPRPVTWTESRGGFSTWLTLPPGLSSTDLYSQALGHGVVFAPGKLFLTSGDSERYLRLSFGMLEPDAIRESVRELARLTSQMATESALGS